VLVYAPRSLARETPGKEAFAYPAMALLLAGLTGMSLTGDLFNLYVFLEIAALAAYALLAVGDRGAPVAVFRYLLVGALGGGFYLVGVAFLYFSAGTLNMADLYVRLPELVESRAVVAAAVFMVIGLGVKMALFPMHFWLPDVYTNAPTSVSGLIAPIMTKVSAYAIIRIFISVYPPGFFTEAIPLATTIGWLAAGGILFGSILAVAQQDYRRMLAYSSVGQISYVALGIGLANPIGLIGGLLHILNHALMKGMLFLIAGAVRFRTGVTLIPRMKGLGRKMPWTMAAFVVGALAMVGIPPTAGFFSKWYLLLGALEAGNWWWFAVIIVSSLLSAIYFFRMVEMIYREPDEGEPEPTGDVGEGEGEAPASMLIPILILALAILGAGLLNFWIVTELLSHAVAGLGG
jgi:multicomponent Na+:H+ antiporter subunit D